MIISDLSFLADAALASDVEGGKKYTKIVNYKNEVNFEINQYAKKGGYNEANVNVNFGVQY